MPFCVVGRVSSRLEGIWDLMLTMMSTRAEVLLLSPMAKGGAWRVLSKKRTHEKKMAHVTRKEGTREEEG